MSNKLPVFSDLSCFLKTGSVDPVRFIEKVVVCHHDDMDGAVAAACALRCLELHYPLCAVECIPVNYNTYDKEYILEKVDDKTAVFVLDFCFPVEFSDELNQKSGIIQVLDHHKTSMDMMKDRNYAYFDMNSSGAKMAFDYFFPGRPTPLAVTLVDNRDLWIKTDGREDSFHLALLSVKYEKYHGDNLSFIKYLGFLVSGVSHVDRAYIVKRDAIIDDLVGMGLLMWTQQQSDIKYVVVPNNLFNIELAGHKTVTFFYGVNQSDACEYLYSQEKYMDCIVAAISVRKTGMKFSIRRHKSLNVDLSKVAEQYGGGGRAETASFTLGLVEGMTLLAK